MNEAYTKKINMNLKMMTIIFNLIKGIKQSAIPDIKIHGLRSNQFIVPEALFHKRYLTINKIID